MMPIMTLEPIEQDELAFDIKCPTCEQHANFNYRGTQTFPDVVAEKLGLPAEIHLWSCDHCHTTISHVDLGIEL